MGWTGTDLNLHAKVRGRLTMEKAVKINRAAIRVAPKFVRNHEYEIRRISFLQYDANMTELRSIIKD